MEKNSAVSSSSASMSRRNLLRGAVAVVGGSLAASSILPLSANSQTDACLKYKCCVSQTGYVWRIDVLPAMRSDFRANFANLDRFNKGLPDSARFVAVYETTIGRRDEPPFQVWFAVDSLAEFEKLASAEGIVQFHKELDKYIDPNFRPTNEFVTRLKPSST